MIARFKKAAVLVVVVACVVFLWRGLLTLAAGVSVLAFVAIESTAGASGGLFVGFAVSGASKAGIYCSSIRTAPTGRLMSNRYGLNGGGIGPSF